MNDNDRPHVNEFCLQYVTRLLSEASSRDNARYKITDIESDSIAIIVDQCAQFEQQHRQEFALVYGHFDVMCGYRGKWNVSDRYNHSEAGIAFFKVRDSSGVFCDYYYPKEPEKWREKLMASPLGRIIGILTDDAKALGRQRLMMRDEFGETLYVRTEVGHEVL
jgi:hypothetical protein